MVTMPPPTRPPTLEVPVVIASEYEFVIVEVEAAEPTKPPMYVFENSFPMIALPRTEESLICPERPPTSPPI